MTKIKLADTMLGAADVLALARYYEELLGLRRLDEGDGSFVVLQDETSAQRLCIIPDPARRPCPGLETADLDAAIARITALGGRVLKRENGPKMSHADCEDPAGHCFLIWQSH